MAGKLVVFAAVESPACGLTAVWGSKGLRHALTQQTRATAVRSGQSDANVAQPPLCAGALEAISALEAHEPSHPPTPLHRLRLPPVQALLRRLLATTMACLARKATCSMSELQATYLTKGTVSSASTVRCWTSNSATCGKGPGCRV